MVSVTYLEPASPEDDPYDREIVEPGPIETEGGDESNVYEVEKIIAKRMVYTERGRRRRAHSEFRVKWLGWGDLHNAWMIRADLNNAKKLLHDFEYPGQAEGSHEQSIEGGSISSS